jgi:hypothetical protein
MKKCLLILTIVSLSGCVEMQHPLPAPVPGAPQVAFHPTLYVTPGTVGGVSKSTYTVTEMNR